MVLEPAVFNQNRASIQNVKPCEDFRKDVCQSLALKYNLPHQWFSSTFGLKRFLIGGTEYCFQTQNTNKT